MDLSIVVANYNKALFIINCLQSLDEQDTSYKYEVVIVDDGSDDNSVALIDKFLADRKINGKFLFFPREHEGKIQAYNFGVSKATGKFIKIFGSDDVAFLNLVEDIVRESASTNVILHNCSVTDERGLCLKKNYLNLTTGMYTLSLPLVISGMSFPSGNYVFSNQVADLIFPIPTEATYEDWYVAFVLAINHIPVFFDSTPLFNYTQTRGSAWGGVFNYSCENYRRRASRDMAMTEFFQRTLGSNYLLELSTKRTELDLILKDNLLQVLFSDLGILKKAEIIIRLRLGFLINIAKKFMRR